MTSWYRCGKRKLHFKTAQSHHLLSDEIGSSFYVKGVVWRAFRPALLLLTTVGFTQKKQIEVPEAQLSQ